jgi:hypothetical protein
MRLWLLQLIPLVTPVAATPMADSKVWACRGCRQGDISASDVKQRLKMAVTGAIAVTVAGTGMAV